MTAAAPLAYDASPGEWCGTCDFRMMPTDDFTGAASTLSVAGAAAGRALLLTYTWSHPADGDQTGTLLLGAAGDDGSVAAAWVDSWHQRDVVALAGRGDASSARVGYEYDPGWRWEVDVRVGGGGVSLVMRNVVPEGQDGPTGPYDVMRATWS